MPSLDLDNSDEIRGLVETLKKLGYDNDEAMSHLRSRYYAYPAEQFRRILDEVYGK